MARVEVWESVINTSGVPVSSASVHIYDARTTNHTTVYSAETGPTTLSQPLTTSNGNIPGWVDEGEYDIYIPSSSTTVRFNAIVGGNPSLGALTIDTGDIADDAITAAKIAPGAVGSSEIAADAVGSSEIATDAVTSAEILAGAVGTAELADDSVTAAKIAADAVGTSEIATDAVTAAEIAADTITTSELADNAVAKANIADDAVGPAEIEALPVCVLAGSMNVANNTETAMTWTTAPEESCDPTGMHSISTNPTRVTIGTTGLYHIVAEASSTDADLVDNDVTWIKLFLNGIQIASQTTRADYTIASETRVGLDMYLPLSATNYIEAKIYQLTGATITYTCRLSVVWVSPSS